MKHLKLTFQQVFLFIRKNYTEIPTEMFIVNHRIRLLFLSQI